jgi:mitochondrial fission protein ELM1
VLAAPGAGDNRQLSTLVELIGAEARWFEKVDPVSRVLRDRAFRFGARAVPADRRHRYRPPWPDLVLIAGGRSVIDARRIRHASGGRTSVVCIGRPWAPLRWFDLVVTTPQYRLPTAPNVLTLDLPLNRPPAPPEALDGWHEALSGLPSPRVGVLLGGDSGSYRFPDGHARALADRLNRSLAANGGSALIVGSPRTPPAALRALESALRVPASIHPFGADGNPYAAVFALADALLVTSDSASMVAEACFSGKPVALFDLSERLRSRLNRRLRALTPFLQPGLARLTAKGLWIPARDLSVLRRRVAASGWVRPMEALLTSQGAAAADADAVLAPVKRRIEALLAR